MTELSLSTRLRESSMEAHKQAEGSSFVKHLFQGQCSDEKYAQYVWALHQVYETLEDSMTDLKDQDQIKCVYNPELFRSQPLAEDLKTWATHQFPEALKKDVQAYTDHLLELKKNRPHLLVSHAYVRYLGDLSGGQMLAKILKKRFPESDGLHFYEYPFSNFAERKDEYRAQLDLIGQQVPQFAEEICEEAVQAFKWNERIFNSLN